MVEKFSEALLYESRRTLSICDDAKVSKSTKTLAKEVIKKQKLQLITPGYYTYKQCTGDIFNIDVGKKTCSCDRYLDKGTCKHLTAACMLEDVPLNGLKSSRNVLLTRRRRAKKLIIDSDDEEPVDSVQSEQIQSQSQLSEPEPSDPVYSEPVYSEPVYSEPIIKAKRGRPTLAEQALRTEKATTKAKKTKNVAKSDRVTRSQKF